MGLKGGLKGALRAGLKGALKAGLKGALKAASWCGVKGLFLAGLATLSAEVADTLHLRQELLTDTDRLRGDLD